MPSRSTAKPQSRKPSSASPVTNLDKPRTDPRPPAVADIPRKKQALPAEGGPTGRASHTRLERADKAEKMRTRPETGRVCDARPDTLDFRDRMYEPTLIEVPSSIPLKEYLDCKVPVLDQGQEGACTGFGLATVANYLLLRRKRYPDPIQVSARMFYELARRYDEWPGEDYEGSSARGAMKGWHKHGVCSWDDWPYEVGDDDYGFTDTRMCAACKRPLGSYFRVNHKDLIAMHAAIAEVGVLYATCAVHKGWQEVGPDGIIHQSDEMIGGHAFAIVAYDENGLWIQNSWGKDWGHKGMCRLSYDDWLENGTDVWVARLGAPANIDKPLSFATAHASTSGQSVAYTYANLRPHLISVGNDGKLQPGGDYGTDEREIAGIFKADLPPLIESRKITRILLYAHGGLVSADAAVQRVVEYRAPLLDAGVYPLAFIWHSDYWTTITNILQDAVRRRRPEGALDQAKDFMLDRLDDALEPIARLLTGKAGWDEMKENALGASASGGAGDIVVGHIVDLLRTYPEIELHLVGHSAGSIFLAPLAQLLAAEGEIGRGPIKGRSGHGLPVNSLTLWAPACTIELFDDCYRDLIEHGKIKRSTLFCLNDKTEQDDNCARIYNKSLLYLVSNAFENKPRIPALRDGVALLGMAKAIGKDKALSQLIDSGKIDLVIAPNNQPLDADDASKAMHHGDFDDDPATVSSTFKRIVTPRPGPATGMVAAKAPVRPKPELEGEIEELVFETSRSKLRTRRLDIDSRTRLVP